MALTDLLAALERDAGQRMARDRAEAVALAEQIGRDAGERVARRRAEALARERAHLETAAARDVALASRAAEHGVLASREALLTLVLDAARDRIRAGALPTGTAEALAILACKGVGHVGGAAATIRCAPAMLPALRAQLDGAAGVEVVPDAAVPSGALITTTDGRLVIDASLDGRLTSAVDEARIAILQAIEALR